jgi:hypothetical protein
MREQKTRQGVAQVLDNLEFVGRFVAFLVLAFVIIGVVAQLSMTYGFVHALLIVSGAVIIAATLRGLIMIMGSRSIQSVQEVIWQDQRLVQERMRVAEMRGQGMQVSLELQQEARQLSIASTFLDEHQSFARILDDLLQRRARKMERRGFWQHVLQNAAFFGLGIVTSILLARFHIGP